MTSCFSLVREGTDCRQVAQDSGLELKDYGRYLQGKCVDGHDSQGGNCFTVYENGFTCFHCGLGGDATALWARVKGLDQYPAALELAQKYNLTLPAVDENTRREMVQRRSEEDRLFSLLTEACGFFHQQLTPDRADFLRRRYGLLPDYLREKRIGFAPVSTKALREYLLQKGYTHREMVRSGLFYEGREGRTPFPVYRGRLVFPYWEGGRVVYTAARVTEDTPPVKEGPDTRKYLKQRTHQSYPEEVSPVIGNRLLTGSAARPSPWVAVVEGVTDFLLADQLGLPVMSPATVRFKSEDLESLTHFCQTKEVVFVVGDSDKPGRAGAQDTVQALEKRDLRVFEVVLLEVSPDHPALTASDREDLNKGKVDLNLWLRTRPEDPAESFRGLLGNGLSLPRRAVLQDLKELDTARGLKSEMVLKKKGERILADLRQRGTFYREPEGSLFFFRDADHRLVRIGEKESATVDLLVLYGLNPKEKAFPYAVGALEAWARSNGSMVRVHGLSVYDPDRFTLYLSDFQGGVYRIQPSGVTHQANGDGGILFLNPPDAEGYEIGEPETAEPWINRLILDTINFAEDDFTREESRLLLETWMLATFFPAIFPTRPLLTILGDQGSGKSMSLQLWLKMVFGSQAELMSLPRAEDGFIAAGANSPLMFLDNVDTPKDWLENKLATSATGAKEPARRLYSDQGIVAPRIQSFIALTSRTPCFTRPDVADRMLVLRCQRLTGPKRPPAELFKEIATHRGDLMTDLVRRLLDTVRALQATAGSPAENFTSEFRMADFTSFLLRRAHYHGKEAEAQALRLCQKLVRAKSAFTLEDDLVWELMQLWLSDEVNRGFPITHRSLMLALGRIAAAEGIRFPYDTPKSFGYKMRAIMPDLRNYLAVKEYPPHHGHKQYSYDYRPSGEISRGDYLTSG
ncbi:MAG: hypothetical protein C4524_04110 [Candidatus Zixiibacteriota bacterium]|nr:MAG: hypothetical protein C4524_04110 [candidate division Zixibacteria bacterium]